MPKFRLICQQEVKTIREAPIEVEAESLEDALEIARAGLFPEDGWRTMDTDIEGWTYLTA